MNLFQKAFVSDGPKVSTKKRRPLPTKAQFAPNKWTTPEPAKSWKYPVTASQPSVSQAQWDTGGYTQPARGKI